MLWHQDYENIKYNETLEINLNEITTSMWNNYGRVFAEYMFIKKFRYQKKNENIIIEGREILEEIKKLEMTEN